jgi:hypothetical protein
MCARVHDQKRQFELVRPDEFFRERAERVGVELRIRRREIDEIVRVGERRGQFFPLGVIEKRRDLFRQQRPGEPLHVVLHENLNRRAIDRAPPLDRAMDSAAD